jgi:predicted nucleic acid-binding protein
LTSSANTFLTSSKLFLGQEAGLAEPDLLGQTTRHRLHRLTCVDIFNKKRLETFLAGPVHALSFEEGDAEIAGQIRADLEAAGKPIGAYDLLIAGQAMRNKLTLITANISEFARIKALAWADWGKP